MFLLLINTINAPSLRMIIDWRGIADDLMIILFLLFTLMMLETLMMAILSLMMSAVLSLYLYRDAIYAKSLLLVHHSICWLRVPVGQFADHKKAET